MKESERTVEKKTGNDIEIELEKKGINWGEQKVRKDNCCIDTYIEKQRLRIIGGKKKNKTHWKVEKQNEGMEVKKWKENEKKYNECEGGQRESIGWEEERKYWEDKNYKWAINNPRTDTDSYDVRK